MKRRDGRSFVGSSRDVAVRNDFYTVSSAEGGNRRSLEDFYSSSVESPAAEAFRRILREEHPPKNGSEDQLAIANFMSFQLTRTPFERGLVQYASRVRDFLQGRQLTPMLMQEFLESDDPTFSPSESETRSAFNFVNYQLEQLSVPNVEEASQILLHISNRIVPELLKRTWSVAIDRKERFVTSDSPISMISRSRPGQASSGVGVSNASEIRLPISPWSCLVLSLGNRPSHLRLSTVQSHQFNLATINLANEFIIGRPSQLERLEALDFAPRLRRLRFSQGPLVTSSSGASQEIGEVLQLWID